MSNTWHTSSSCSPYNSHLYNTYSTYAGKSSGLSTTQSILRPHLIRSAADLMLRGITSESQSICVEDSIGNTRDNELMKIQRMSTTASSDAVNNINIANANCGLTQQLITDLKTKTKRSTNNGNKSTTSGLSAKMSSQEELSQILKYLLWRQEIEDQHNRMVHEWRLLALAVDKVLFWVFLIITLVSSLSFLVIIPIQRRGFPF